MWMRFPQFFLAMPSIIRRAHAQTRMAESFHMVIFLVHENNSTIAIVHWELAGVLSPAHDPAFFLAHTRLFLHYNLANESILHFMDVYRDNARAKDVSWYKNEHEQYLFAWHLGMIYGSTLLCSTGMKPCCPGEHRICCHKHSLIVLAVDYIRRCQLGPVKVTYDSMSNDPFLGRLFHASHTD